GHEDVRARHVPAGGVRGGPGGDLRQDPDGSAANAARGGPSRGGSAVVGVDPPAGERRNGRPPELLQLPARCVLGVRSPPVRRHRPGVRPHPPHAGPTPGLPPRTAGPPGLIPPGGFRPRTTGIAHEGPGRRASRACTLCEPSALDCPAVLRKLTGCAADEYL